MEGTEKKNSRFINKSSRKNGKNKSKEKVYLKKSCRGYIIWKE